MTDPTEQPVPPPTENRLQAFREGMPASFRCRGVRYFFRRQFKHDFFAATGMYESRDGCRVVLKLQRLRPYFGLPLRWLGELLTRHEAACYRDLADVHGVPALVGFHGPTGFVHEFVPGRNLSRDMPVSDRFFDELEALLSAVHARGIAYVDLNKRQNIIVGDDDGRPGLIDFQISFRLGRRGGEIPRVILRTLQDHDWYHFGKHKRRVRPDLMTEQEIRDSYRLSPLVQMHRRFTWPYFKVRRWILTRLGLPIGDEAEG